MTSREKQCGTMEISFLIILLVLVTDIASGQLNYSLEYFNPTSPSSTLQHFTTETYTLPFDSSEIKVIRLKSSAQGIKPVDPSCVMLNSNLLAATTNTEIKFITLDKMQAEVISLNELIPKDYRSSTLFDPRIVYAQNTGLIHIVFVGFYYDKRFLCLSRFDGKTNWKTLMIHLSDSGIIDYPQLKLSANQRELVFTFQGLINGQTHHFGGLATDELNIKFIKPFEEKCTVTPIGNSNSKKHYDFLSACPIAGDSVLIALHQFHSGSDKVSLKTHLTTVPLNLKTSTEQPIKADVLKLSHAEYNSQDLIYSCTIDDLFSGVFIGRVNQAGHTIHTLTLNNRRLMHPSFKLSDKLYLCSMYFSSQKEMGLVIMDFLFKNEWIQSNPYFLSTASYVPTWPDRKWGDFTSVYIHENKIVYAGYGFDNTTQQLIVVIRSLK